MADVKTTGLTSLAATPADNDLLMIVDVSDTNMAASGTNKKIALSYFANTDGNNALVTGGGTVALGGRSFTVPASGTAALLATQNTFTRQITVQSSSTSDHGVNINMPAGVATTARALRITVDSTLRANIQVDSANSYFSMAAYDNGANEGCYVTLGRNSNASTPAAGFVAMTDKGGQSYRVWPDDSGVMRINTADPTNGNDTAGTVIGSQTSHAAYKDVLGDPLADADALAELVAAASHVKRFIYKTGAYNNEEFSGLVLDGDNLQRYGMDPDVEHPAGRSLNIINLLGDLLLAMRNLSSRVAALES